MKQRDLLTISLSLLCILALTVVTVCAQDRGTLSEPKNSSTGAFSSQGLSGEDAGGAISAVIYPFQSATVGSEVRGVLGDMKYKVGDHVQKGAVIAEVSKPRYQAILEEFQGNYQAICRTLDEAQEELKVQDEKYNRRATTYHNLLKAQYQVKILEARKEEAAGKMKQAELNVTACVLKAPFSGDVAVLYREPAETVDYLEKVFEIVDTSKVFARANWPEKRISELKPGGKAVFQYMGKDFQGTVDQIATLIDPGAKRLRVHVVIDNPNGELRVGMSGKLRLE